MNRTTLLFLLAFSFNFLHAQNTPGKDIWSGKLLVYPDKNEIPADTLLLTRTADIAADKVASRYEADLARWQVISSKDPKKDSILLRRFLSNDKDDEYKEFGWTALHNAGKMNCLDGGHFFICQTDPNTKVELKGDQPFFTESGIFGVWLHYGLVALKKIK